jgi:hypothetical protein
MVGGIRWSNPRLDSEITQTCKKKERNKARSVLLPEEDDELRKKQQGNETPGITNPGNIKADAQAAHVRQKCGNQRTCVNRLLHD